MYVQENVKYTWILLRYEVICDMNRSHYGAVVQDAFFLSNNFFTGLTFAVWYVPSKEITLIKNAFHARSQRIAYKCVYKELFCIKLRNEISQLPYSEISKVFEIYQLRNFSFIVDECEMSLKTQGGPI